MQERRNFLLLVLGGSWSLAARASQLGYSLDGTYAVSEFLESDNEVSFVLSIEIANRSAGEIHYGRLAIPLSRGRVQAPLQFDRIFLQRDESVQLSGGLILDRTEYRARLGGSSLRASFEWFDENAVPHSAELELRETPASGRR